MSSIVQLRFAVILAVAVLLTGRATRAQSAAAPPVFTVAEFMRVRTPSNVALSPDGRHVAFVVEDRDTTATVPRLTIHVLPAAGGTPRRLTEGGSPRWSSDGKQIAFLSSGSGPRRLFRIPATGGVAVPLTDDSTNVFSFAWSPRAEIAAIVSQQRPGPPQLILIDTRRGARRRLDVGRLAPSDLAWSPRGDALVLESRADLYVVATSGGAPRELVRRDGYDGLPRWSPDGSQIAFASGQGSWHRPVRLSIVPASGGTPKELGTTFDRWLLAYPPRFLDWSADGRALYFSAIARMSHLLYAIDIATDSVREVTPGPQAFWSFSLSGDRRTLAYLASDSASAGDVVIAPLASAPLSPRRITNLNPQLSSVRLGRVERIAWKSADGLEVEGLLVKPPTYTRGRRYPMLVQMEGTFGTYDLSFTGRVAADDNFPFIYQQQVFAGAGYMVLLPNPRGSWGFGEVFARKGAGDFGTGPVADILGGIDAVVARGDVDTARIGIMGTGYDSHRALLAVARTRRFKALSVDSPMYDLIRLRADIGGDSALIDRPVGGTPTDKREEWARISPSTYADSIHTPTLITMDEGSPYASAVAKQRDALRQALVKNGVAVEVLPFTTPAGLYPPKTLALLVQRNLDWFKRWIPPIEERASQ